jgi:pyruvate kinase
MNEYIKTKIIATIGPGTGTEEKITELVKAGARIFRLNSSHEEPEVHKERIRLVRKVADKLKIYLPVILDLQGPKIRVGKLKEPIMLEPKKTVVIKPVFETEEEGTIPVDYEGITKDVKKGDKILLDDGKLELKVLSVKPDSIQAEVIYGGLLKSRKGLNLPGTTTGISAVTERDTEYIKFAVENNIAYIALSFVRSKEDIMKAKQFIKKFGGNIPIIAKIEKPQAVENLDSIIAASDGVMVARGDLGIEISPEKVPIVQKKIIKEANAQRKAVIVATQMLESMIENPMPTRAEASDVANAIIDGADAIMLSGETAVGKYAAEAVNMMKLIAQNVESTNLCRCNKYESEAKEMYEVDSQAITSAVIRMLDEVEINAIVAFTRTGFTGRLLSKAKPSVPVISISEHEEICKRLNLFWGIFPHCLECERDLTSELLNKIDKMLIDETFINQGDKIVITGAIPYLTTGKTNFIRLHQVGSASTMH